MRRLIASIGTTSILLVPQLSLAAFQQPSELFDVLQQQTQAQTFSAEGHIDAKEGAASLWMSGSAEGTEIATMQADIKFTLHVLMNKELVKTTARVKVVDQTAYFIVDSLDTGGNAQIAASLADVKVGQWYSLSLTNATGQQSDVDQMREEIRQSLDTMLTMTSTVDTNTTLYSLTFSREFRRRVMPSVREWADKLHGSTSVPVLNLHVKAEVSNNDELLQSLKYYFSVANGSDFSAVLQGNQQPSTQPLTVIAPTNAIDVSSHLPSSSGMQPSVTPAPSSSPIRPTTPCSPRRRGNC